MEREEQIRQAKEELDEFVTLKRMEVAVLEQKVEQLKTALLETERDRNYHRLDAQVLRTAIAQAIQYAGSHRYDWGDRATEAFRILERATGDQESQS